jgi:uncharacterized membrane protein YuzA (DUF378 family)
MSETQRKSAAQEALDEQTYHLSRIHYWAVIIGIAAIMTICNLVLRGLAFMVEQQPY